MIPTIRIDGPHGTRHLENQDFPLSIGGSGADIALFGPESDEPSAWLGLSDGALFVQAGSGGEPIVCNGDPVTASQWLHEGDSIRVGQTRIDVRKEGRDWSLRIGSAATPASPAPPPPTVPAAGTVDSSGLISPVSFTPRQPEEAMPRSAGRWRRPLALFGIVSMAAFLAWTLLTLRPIELRIDPLPDRVAIRGSRLFGWKLAGRYLLHPGEYEIVADKAGYRRLEAPIRVMRDDNPPLVFALDRLPGILTLDAHEARDADVIVDGETVGSVPLAPLELTAGDHLVRIESEHYLEFETRVTIEGGGLRQVLNVILTPRTAPVTIRSTPAGAAIRVDGEGFGTTPATVPLPAGKHALELRLAGYRNYSESLRVTANQPLELATVKLRVADGKLRFVTEPPGATVIVDGEFSGRTPAALSLSAKTSHTIEASKAGYRSVRREVRLEPGETRELSIGLDEFAGELQFAVRPSDAKLYVNGDPRGPANQTLRLQALPQRIEIRAEGFDTYATTVTPRPGISQTVRVELLSLEAKRAARMPPLIESSAGFELVRIDGGRFKMGAARREPGRRANETEREVELIRPFYLATTEVDNRQFRKFDSKHLSGAIGTVSLEVDDHPAVRVTWDEAARYCNWLSEKESLPPAYAVEDDHVKGIVPLTTGYRLPTEAEWAWAARMAAGARPLKYPWGPALPVPAGAGNYADDSSRGLASTVLDGYRDGFAATAPVKSFQPNPLGLFDIGGNVSEWMHDLYTVYPSAAGSTARDPSGPVEGTLHVIRGSSWMDASVTALRLSYRNSGAKARPDVGFRVARYAE